LVGKSVKDYHYSMHRLVRDFFLEYLKNEGKLEAQQQFAVELLSDGYPYGDESLWTVCRTFNPHAEKAIKYKGPDVWPRAALLRNMASYHQNCGRHATAYALYMKTRKIYASNTLCWTRCPNSTPEKTSCKTSWVKSNQRWSRESPN
jgi:hypothetical protein